MPPTCRSGRTLVQALLFLSFPALAAGAIVARSFVVHGEWYAPAIGRAVGGVQFRAASDSVFPLPYPSAVYVRSDACRFCPEADARLAAFVDSMRGSTLRVFALSHDGRPAVLSDSALGGAVTPVRLAERHPAFAFVREIPMLIRIGADGAIERAYVGVPHQAELEALLIPHDR
jgi:hypothetical protein